MTHEFQLGFMTYLVSEEKLIYVAVDGRGTSGNGDNYLYDIYLRLGTVEVEDQLTAMK